MEIFKSIIIKLTLLVTGTFWSYLYLETSQTNRLHVNLQHLQG